MTSKYTKPITFTPALTNKSWLRYWCGEIYKTAIVVRRVIDAVDARQNTSS